MLPSDRIWAWKTHIHRTISSQWHIRRHQLLIRNNQQLMRPVHLNTEGTVNSCSMYHSHLDVPVVLIPSLRVMSKPGVWRKDRELIRSDWSACCFSALMSLPSSLPSNPFCFSPHSNPPRDYMLTANPRPARPMKETRLRDEVTACKKLNFLFALSIAADG